MKNNAFVRLPVLEAAKMPWDTFAVERLIAVWCNFDTSFKGILREEVTRPTPIVQADRRVAHSKSAKAGDKTYSHRTGR